MVNPAPGLFTYSTDPTTSFQLVLQDDELTYDAVDNPVHIRDWRNPAEWPVGSKPASRTMQYDDLNRVTRIDYQYHDGSNSQGNDDWISPFENENTGANVDSRIAMPSPHVSFSKRVLSQTMLYDWLGNQTATDDDSHGFYDRSLGTVTNNTTNDKPYQLTGALQTTGTNTGSLETEYDVAGNLVDMAVIRDGDCLPTGAVCSQRFVYDWDEVGRLIRARRWDMASPSVQDSIPSGVPAADLRHGYDASDNRVIRSAVDENEESSYTVYIFGTLELRRTSFDTSGTPDDYTDDIDTEVGYLFGHGVRLARLHWEDSGSPVIGGANLHVLFELGDHLGSSSKVLDKATSELVESSTYMGYGQAESDYRPGRWKNFREDYRFTGKEEDFEVGLTYFGKRFLSSQLGRWVSADPLSLHRLPGEPNLYAYVSGRVFVLIDAVGLEGEPKSVDMFQQGWRKDVDWNKWYQEHVGSSNKDGEDVNLGPSCGIFFCRAEKATKDEELQYARIEGMLLGPEIAKATSESDLELRIISLRRKLDGGIMGMYYDHTPPPTGTFNSRDEAVAAAESYHNPISIAWHREVEGLVEQVDSKPGSQPQWRPTTGRFASRSGSDPYRLANPVASEMYPNERYIRAGGKIAGEWHAHGSEDSRYRGEEASSADIKSLRNAQTNHPGIVGYADSNSLFKKGKGQLIYPSYVATPGGYLLRMYIVIGRENSEAEIRATIEKIKLR